MSTFAIREKHIDRLLSEELECSTEFACWFCREVFGENEVPSGKPECKTEIGYFRTTGNNNRKGETDIRVEMSWPTGEKRIIHIEDKITAGPQPDQAERYAETVRSENQMLTLGGKAAVALVCPESWLVWQRDESKKYGATLTFERLSRELERRCEELSKDATGQSIEIAKRLRWRISILSGGLKKKILEGEYSSDLTKWNEDASKIILEATSLELEVKERTEVETESHESRHIGFAYLLSCNRRFSGKRPKVKLKTFSSRSRARISLEISLAENVEDLREKARKAGYDPALTRAKTLMLEKSSPVMENLSTRKQVDDQIDALEEAARITVEMIQWWEHL